MHIFYEWDDGSYGPTWDDEGGPPREEEDDTVTVVIPQTEIYLEVHDGLPWDDNCTLISD